MTANQFRAALSKLGLSQRGAARILQLNERSTRRFASGERSISPQISTILRLMLAGKISAKDIEAIKE